MFLGQSFQKVGGKKYAYWVLKETVWDKSLKRNVHRYLAYIGRRPVLTLEKARKIAEKLGVSLDDLRRVRRLKIIDEEREQ